MSIIVDKALEAQERDWLVNNWKKCEGEVAVHSYTSLQMGCEKFSVRNIKNVGLEVATEWLRLFQLYRHCLAKRKLTAAYVNFEKAFPTKKVGAVFLESHYIAATTSCEHRREGCRQFSPEVLNTLDRTIALKWVQLFEQYEDEFDKKVLGSVFKSFHARFTIKPYEARKEITVVCLDNQMREIPFSLVLIHRQFQKLLASNKLPLHNSSLAAVKLLERYLFEKTVLPEAITSIPLLIELLDLARLIEDPALVDQLMNQFTPTEPYAYLKSASQAAVSADREKNPAKAKELYISAIEQRPLDVTSRVRLTKILFKEGEYKAALLSIDACLQLAPFRNDLYEMQAEIRLAYARKIEKELTLSHHELGIAGRKMRLGEKVDLSHTLQFLYNYIIDSSEFAAERQFSKLLAEAVEQAKEGLLQQEGVLNLQKGLERALFALKSDLLGHAREMLRKSPSDRNKKQLFLEGELLFEMGEYRSSLAVFEALKKRDQQGSTFLSDSQRLRLHCNMGAVYVKMEKLVEAKLSFSEALLLDPENREILREMILLDESTASRMAGEYLEKHRDDWEVRLAYAKAVHTVDQYLLADHYNAHVCYALGSLLEEEESEEYFSRALLFAHEDNLSVEQVLWLTHHYLIQENYEKLESCLEVIDQLPTLGEQQEEVAALLVQVAETVDDLVVKEKAIRKAHELDPDGVGSLTKKMRALSLTVALDVEEIQEQLAHATSKEEELRAELEHAEAAQKVLQKVRQEELARAASREEALKAELTRAGRIEEMLKARLARSATAEEQLKSKLVHVEGTEEGLQEQLIRAESAEKELQAQLMKAAEVEKQLQERLAIAAWTEEGLQGQLKQAASVQEMLKKSEEENRQLTAIIQKLKASQPIASSLEDQVRDPHRLVSERLQLVGKLPAEVAKKMRPNLETVEKALKAFQNYLNNAKNSSYTLTERAKFLKETDRIEALKSHCMRDYNDFIREKEEVSKRVAFLQKQLQKIGEDVKRTKYMMKACNEIYPNESDVLLELGKVFLAEENFRKAKSSFTAVTDVRTKEVLPLVLLGRAHLGLEEFDQADQVLLRALTIDPKNIQAHHHYIQVMQRQSDRAEVRKRLDAALKACPDQLGTLLTLNPAVVSDLTITHVPRARQIFAKKVLEPNAGIDSFCTLTCLCLDDKDKSAANEHFTKVISWHDEEEIVQHWEQFLGLITYAIDKIEESNLIKAAIERVLTIFTYRTEDEKMGEALVSAMLTMAKTAASLAEERDNVHILLQSLQFMQKFLAVVQSDLVEQAALGLALLAMDKKRTREVMPFLIERSTADNPFASVRGQRELLRSLIGYINSYSQGQAATKKIGQELVQKLNNVMQF